MNSVYIERGWFYFIIFNKVTVIIYVSDSSHTNLITKITFSGVYKNMKNIIDSETRIPQYIFPCTYLVCTTFLCRPPLGTWFNIYIPNTRWIKNDLFLEIQLDYCFCEKPLKISTKSCKA